MAILDIVSKVLTRYEADTSDHRRELEKLKGAERERAQSTIDAHKRVEESLDKQNRALEKASAAFTAIGVAARGARDLVIDYVEHERVRAAAAGADIEKLRKASAGLKTDTQLLADAAKFNAGMFKLTSEQMEVAEKAMLSLTRRGQDATEVNKKILDAVTALKTDGLQELGIVVDKTGLSMDSAADRARLYERVMAALTAESARMGDAQLTAAEKAQQAAVKFENAWDRINNKGGQMLMNLPGAIEQETRSSTRRWVGMNFGPFAPNMMNEAEWQRFHGGPQGMTDAEWMQALASRAQIALDVGGRGGSIGEAIAGNVPEGASNAELLMANIRSSLANYRYTTPDRGGLSWATPPKPGGAGGARPKDAAAIDNIWEQGVSATVGMLIRDAMSYLKEGDERDTAATAGALAGYGSDVKFEGDRINAMLEQAKKSLSGTGDAMSAEDRYAAFNARGSESRLAKMFGPVDEINGYKVAFDALGGAVGAAMTAWIDGSMGAGKAFKLFIADALKGLAVHAAVESLKHLAMAAASAIPGPTFNPAGVGGNLKVAALYAGVAAAAAVGAKTLGGGGSAPGASGAGAAAPVGGGGGGGFYRGEHRTIIVGDSFGDESPRKRARTFRRREEEANGASGVANR